MKQVGLLVFTMIFSFALTHAQTNKAKIDMAFDKTVDGVTFHDYGSIVYGANGKVDFIFTNQGTQPLIISDVKSSCGCTIPTWTKEPVEPGKTGVIKVAYNTTLPGAFNKTIVVYSNANNSPIRIEVRGKVNSQPGDIKSANGSTVKPNEATPNVDGKNGSGNNPDLDNSQESISLKARQRAAYQARIEKEKSKQNSDSKTAPAVKPATGTTTKKSTASATTATGTKK